MKKTHGSDAIHSGRRRFIVGTGTALGAAALVSALPRNARAADLPHVALTDATAQALNYTEDAAKVDKAKSPTFIAGSACANCNFYTGAATGFGPCALFPGKAVSAKGWCSGYAKKA